MLRRTRRPRRQREQGQTLIMALAFIAFFGVVLVAVLRVADVSSLQHIRSESTATKDASAEGGAAYAAADAGRSDVALTCAAGNTGKVTMVGGDTATYTVNSCNPGNSAGSGSTGTGPGANCILCVLNLTPSTDPTATVLNLHCGNGCGTDITTNGGDVYVNGSISSASSITAQPAGTHIRFLSGADYSGCTCSPTPTTYAPAIGDPLGISGTSFYVGPPASPLPTGKPNIALAGVPLACGVFPGSTWSQTDGCSLTINSGNVTVHPGLWSTLNIKNNANVTLANDGGSAVYAFTGPLSLSGQAVLVGTKVTLFLTCPGYGPNGALCPTGTSGGSINLGGQGTANIAAPTVADGGQYAAQSVAILADPKLVDPSTSQCIGNGNNCAFISQGQGGGISGTVDLRGAGASLGGNGTANISGRLIVNSLSMQISGHIGSGLSLAGTIPGVSTSTCGVFDSNVSGTTGSSSTTGRAIIQSHCGTSGSLSGVVDFNYTP